MPIPRYAARRDENEAEIVAGLRKVGCDVLQSDDIDLIVGRAGQTFLIEVKVPGRQKRLRPIQRSLRDGWRGHYAIVTTLDEALATVGFKCSTASPSRRQ